jgi:hypothetical protein
MSGTATHDAHDVTSLFQFCIGIDDCEHYDRIKDLPEAVFSGIQPFPISTVPDLSPFSGLPERDAVLSAGEDAAPASPITTERPVRSHPTASGDLCKSCE